MALHYSYHCERFGYQFSLPIDLERKLPQWLASEAFPPLSPRIAIANSRLVVRRILRPELSTFEPNLSSCALKTTSEYEGGLWYYLISWFVPDVDLELDWSEFSVPVLFDGTTPEPLRFRYEDRFSIYGARRAGQA
jgi:hypothetical protein